MKPGETEIIVKNTNIKSSNSVKLLRLLFNYKLSFEEHVDYIQKNASDHWTLLNF